MSFASFLILFCIFFVYTNFSHFCFLLISALASSIPFVCHPSIHHSSVFTAPLPPFDFSEAWLWAMGWGVSTFLSSFLFLWFSWLNVPRTQWTSLQETYFTDAGNHNSFISCIYGRNQKKSIESVTNADTLGGASLFAKGRKAEGGIDM